MQHFTMALLLAIAAIYGCKANGGFVKGNVVPVAESSAVAPEDDPLSAKSREDVPVAILIRLRIADTEAALEDSSLIAATSTLRRKETSGDMIIVEAKDERGTSVGSQAIPDLRTDIVEGIGTIDVSDRVVTMAIPLSGMPDELIVSVPGRPPSLGPQEIDLSEIMPALCDENPQAIICRRRGLAGLPDQ